MVHTNELKTLSMLQDVVVRIVVPLEEKIIGSMSFSFACVVLFGGEVRYLIRYSLYVGWLDCLFVFHSNGKTMFDAKTKGKDAIR